MFTDQERQTKFDQLMSEFQLSESQRKELEDFIDDVMRDSFSDGVSAGRG